MRKLLVSIAFPIALVASACTIQGPDSEPANTARATTAAVAPHETVLLVSLDDGSVIKQTIHTNADLCFKVNSESATTCLTQGEPVIDPATSAVVGFRMIEDRIDLVAKTD